jgi:16S rRNA (guanine966-N2)-methyltransferase
MRIIAGKYRGRVIEMVQSDLTKETSDRVREAVFNVLGGYIHGRVLDLFSGSGAYALESISRGAEMAVCVDNQQKAYETIIKNAKTLDVLNQMEILYMDAHVYIKNSKALFDYIFIDPPYLYPNYDQLISDLSPLLSKEGQLIVETHKKVTLNKTYDTLNQVFLRVYGIKKITMYTHNM